MNADFLHQIRELLPGEADDLLEALARPPETSVRLNMRKFKGSEPKGLAQVPWCPQGYYLPERPAFTFDPILHAGAYYVQDASSMFIAHAIRHLLQSDDPVCYLDLCAAPGGKSTAAIDALPEGSLIVSNEIDGQRAQVLRENIVKWGCPNTVVLNESPAQIGKLTNFFDVIAADMPCSGEGMFRKEEESVNQWSPTLVEQCARRQQSIVDDIWNALKPGGLFIYSTCTFNTRENEDVVDYIIDTYGAESVEIPIDTEWHIHGGIRTSNFCYRFLPHLTRGEGLFLAVLHKNGTDYGRKTKDNGKKSKAKQIKTSIPPACSSFIKEPKDYEITNIRDVITALPKVMVPQMRQLYTNLHTQHCGIPLCISKGKSIISEHALSQSVALSPDAFPEISIDYPTAIAYLQGEAIVLPPDSPKGTVLICYNGYRLGFCKNLGTRANNNYPKEWRIRNKTIPADPIVIL